MFKGRINDFILVAAILLATFWFQNLWIQATQVANIPYSEFQTLLKTKSVDHLVVTDKYIRGDFKEERSDKKKQFITARLEPDLVKDLEGSGVSYTRQVESTIFRDLLSWVLPALIFVGIWIYFARKMYDKGGVGGLMSVGKSRAKLYAETDVKTTFEDVAGVDEAKEELKEVVEFLKNPEEYSRLGARMPKGILLIGPPGTGKTLLAKAVAGEAKVSFFSISGSEFVELFVGVGAARVRDLFEQARKQAPCIIFIDELDALGKMRAPGMISGGHDEKEQTLNQLLAELDGFDTKSGVILLAATNRPEVLDPALLRAGRFDRQVLVDRPDKIGREAILKVHLKKIKLHENVNIEHIAALTPGFTGADLANLVNESALAATRRKSAIVEEDDFLVAIERIVAGLEKKNRILNPKEKKTVAYHEMGHALVGCALPGVDKVQKISIIPRGIGSLGYTIQRPLEDRYLMTKQELLNKMSVLLGGRVAESLVFGEISTGAADDLVKVSNIAEALVTRYGMSSALGNRVFEQQQSPFLEGAYPSYPHREYSEESSRIIDTEIKKMIEEATLTTKRILEANRSLLEKGAELLLEKETLAENEIKDLIQGLVIPGQELPRKGPELTV
ncbi:MAG: ATP-dependent zinc metalloprotease FtsH [Bdellovibrio sp.]|nr:ATP-dependent zinc metalloprotease FtsH [Bdellovibrio sp.]